LKIYLSILASLILFGAVTGCGDDDDDDFSLEGTDLSVTDLAGNWVATRAFFSKAATGPVMEVDVIAVGGSGTLEIQNDSRFTLTIVVPGQAPDVTTGRIAFDEDLLVVFFDDDPEDFFFFGITLSEPNLSVTNTNGAGDFDFDGDGVEEPADLEFDFVRS